MNYEQEREDNAVGPEICSDCHHPIRLHGRYGCEVEGGDEWVDGERMGALAAQAPCGCQAWEMAEEESALEQDRRTSGSFAESQQRLANALNLLTDLALRKPV